MIRTAVTNAAKLEFLQGIHAPGDVYKIALYSAQAKLSADTKTYSPRNEVEAQGYAAGGKILSEHAVSSDGGTAILSFQSPTWDNSSISARGAVIYNSSKENRALAVFDFGADVTSTNATFTAAMPPPTRADGLIRIA